MDGKVAEKLCIGGPVKYKAKEDSGVTLHFLMEVVVPNISLFFANEDETNKVAEVLALPLLFAAFEVGVWECVMSSLVRERIVAGYKQLRGDNFLKGYNPVKKVPLVVHQIENILAIDELVTGVDENGAPIDEQPGAIARFGTVQDCKFKKVSNCFRKNIVYFFRVVLMLFTYLFVHFFVCCTR